MAKIIEAKAIISGEDKLSPLLDRLAKKFAEVGKTTKIGANVEQMASALQRVNAQLQAIERFNASRVNFAAARTQFQEAKIAVQSAAQAMAAAKGPATELAAAYNRAQAAVQGASRGFEAQRGAVLSAMRALQGMGIPINKAVSEQERLRNAIQRANAALDQQGSKASNIRRGIGRAAGTLGMIAGPGILHATKMAEIGGANIQSEIVKMRAAGIPEDDIQRALGSSATLAAKYPNVKRSIIMEKFKELRSILLHPEEAHTLLDPTVRAASAMMAIDRTGHMAEGLGFAIKGAEVLGLAQDPKRYAAYLDAFVRAQQVVGKTITPEQQYEFAKYTKASGPTLSDRFKMTTGVSLSQEMGGATTGVSIDQFVKQVVGGFQGQQHAAAKEFVALGLANKSDFLTTKTGEIKGLRPGRHVKGWQLAMTDPDQYVYQYVIPAMEKNKAIGKDQQKQIAEVRRLFPSGRAADLVAKLITQRPSFAAHAKLYEAAQGLGATTQNQADPFVAASSLTTSLGNFAATLTSPAMESAAKNMSALASSIAGWAETLSQFQKEHPDLAKYAGGGALAVGAGVGGILTYGLVSGLLTGFGLPASAAALTGSAAALTAAAAALGGGAVVPKVASKLAPVGGMLSFLPRLAPGAVVGGLPLAIAGIHWAMPDDPESAAKRKTHGNVISSARRDAWNEERERLGLPALGTPGEVELKGSAEVTGEAKITIEVKETGTLVEVVKRLENATAILKGRLNVNGPGSTGQSSPDAGAWPPE